MKQDPLARGALLVLAGLAVLAALSMARQIAAPFALAAVTALVMSPVQDRLCRLGLGRGLAAAGLLATLVLLFAALAILTEPVVAQVVDALPRIRYEIRLLLDQLRSALRGIELMSEPFAASETEALPSVTQALSLAPPLLAQGLVFFAAFYFFLVVRHEVYAALAATVARAGGPHDMRDRLLHAETRVARYFGTITLINIGLGIALTGVLTVLGIPMAPVWGVAATLLNFVLYLGPGLLVMALLLAGLVHFSGLAILLPAACYLALNGTEAQFVTPSLVGRSMHLNPLVVFAAIVFGLWFWGPAGGIVAIPVLVFAHALREGPDALALPAAPAA